MENERPVSGHLSDLTRHAHQDIMGVEPPALEQYRDAPVYDHTVILRLVAVRPLALWSLEQHIGIASGARGTAELGGQKRRYSERDLVALLWLRERVVEGESPQEAGARLIASQRLRNSGALNSGFLGDAGQTGSLGAAQYAPGRNSGALTMGGQQPTYPPPPRHPAIHSGPLTALDSPTGPIPSMREYAAGGTGGLSASAYPTGGAYTPGVERGEYPNGSWGSGPLGYANTPRAGATSRPLSASASRPLNSYGADATATTPRAAAPSGRLGSIYGAPVPITRPPSGFDAAHDQATARELRGAVNPLKDAFSRFDTTSANRLMQQALERYSIEVVCLGLVQPTIARISELWSKSELSVPEQRFALNYLRGFLSSVFHSTMEAVAAPLVVVCCAQREVNDLSALSLAVFWRRSGLRVLYLGADAGSDDLARQEWSETPVVICLTMSSSQRIRSVNQLARQLHSLPAPRPELCYTGALFARNPELQRKVNAVYLGDDPAASTTTVRRMLGVGF